MGVSAVRLQDKDTGKKLSVIESCECPWKYWVVLVNPDWSRISWPKWDPGPAGPSICSAEFNWDDIDFGRSDGCIVKLEDAKICLQGPSWNWICCTTCTKVWKETTIQFDYTNWGDFCFSVCDGQDGQGSWDVLGPGSSVDWDVVLFDGNGWKCIKDSWVNINCLAKCCDIPTTASDVGALPDNTKYGASLYMCMDSSTYELLMQLKDQDGCNLGSACCVDLPIESMVVDGCYNCSTKEIELTLQNGCKIDFSVADLVSGLQSEITCSNKIGSDCVSDSGQSNKFVSSSDISNWNCKADICDIPTDNCELSNGCGYLKSCDLGWYAKCCDIPTDNCQLANWCGYTKCTWNVSTCADIINRLGYTPYNSTNPNGYTSCTGTLQSCDIACINGCCLTGGGDICIQWGQDYSWITKSISWWEVELWLRTIVNVPTSDFTLVKPADLIDWEEYAIRVISETSYCMCLGSCFTNPRNVDTTLSGNATDQYVFLAIWGELELQPLVDTWA